MDEGGISGNGGRRCRGMALDDWVSPRAEDIKRGGGGYLLASDFG